MIVLPTILLAVAALSRGAVASTAPRVVAVAGVLGGADVVPLAQLVGGRWLRTWPEPDEALDRQIERLEDVPRTWFPSGRLPRLWYAWTEELQAIPIRVRNVRQAEAHCQTAWGLATELPKNGHETTALATNMRSGVQVFLTTAEDPQTRRLIKTEFDRAESAAIRAEHPNKSAEATSSSSDPEVRLWCTELGADDRSLCAFITSRPRPTTPSADASGSCDDRTIFQGWLLQSGAETKVVSSTTTLSDCEGVDVRTSVPMLLIRSDSKAFVVVREHGYEDESFVFVEVHGDTLKRTLEVAGGGC